MKRWKEFVVTSSTVPNSKGKGGGGGRGRVVGGRDEGWGLGVTHATGNGVVEWNGGYDLYLQ